VGEIYSPKRYAVRIDDPHTRWRLRIAAAALWGHGVSIPSFLVLCAEHVIRHHRGLKEVRRTIRQVEAERRRKKRKRALEEKRAKQAALKAWKGAKHG
jgi:heme exporter protein D